MKHIKLFEQFTNDLLYEGFKNIYEKKDMYKIAIDTEVEDAKIGNKFYNVKKGEAVELIDDNGDIAKVKLKSGEIVNIESEYIVEGRIALNHVYANAPVRNKVLELLKNGKISESDFMNAVSKAGAPSKWIQRNSQYFKVEEEDGVKFYSLSKSGQMIMSSIQLNEASTISVPKLSDIDHTRIIKWMSNQFDSNTWDIKKSGKGFEIAIDKLSKAEQEDLMAYLKSQDYIKESTINEASNFGKPAGLSKEETFKIAQKLADAMSKIENEKYTVNKKSIEGDSFDLDVDGEEYDGGSYNLYDNGNIVNHAIGNVVKEPIYGNWKKDDISAMIKKIKAINDQLNESSLVIDPLDLTSNFFYISINGKVYGYQAKPGGDIEEVATTFKKMLKYSSGKALAWLKQNSLLATNESSLG
jgi:hypothetical protein